MGILKNVLRTSDGPLGYSVTPADRDIGSISHFATNRPMLTKTCPAEVIQRILPYSPQTDLYTFDYRKTSLKRNSWCFYVLTLVTNTMSDPVWGKYSPLTVYQRSGSFKIWGGPWAVDQGVIVERGPIMANKKFRQHYGLWKSTVLTDTFWNALDFSGGLAIFVTHQCVPKITSVARN